MNKGERTGKKIVWFLDKTVGVIFACIMFFLLLIGLYSLWDSKMVYAEADSTQWESYKPEENNTESFDELIDLNPDIWGWLNIYGTKINNPLLFKEENPDFYLNHDAKGKPSSPGALYIEAAHGNHLDNFNTIIYGHHMARDLMFGGLDHFADQGYLDEHRYGTIQFINKADGRLQTRGIQVVGLIHTDAYDGSVYRAPIADPIMQKAYVDKLLSMMATKRDIIWDNNKLLVLSTCASGGTNARTVVVCYVEDEVHQNTFIKDPKINLGIGIDQLSGWFGFPWLGWVGLILMICLIILLIIWRIDRYKRKKANKTL